MFEIGNLEIRFRGLKGNGISRFFICEVTNKESEEVELRVKKANSNLLYIEGCTIPAYANKHVVELRTNLSAADWEQDKVSLLLVVLKDVTNYDYEEQMERYNRNYDPDIPVPDKFRHIEAASKAVTVRLR